MSEGDDNFSVSVKSDDPQLVVLRVKGTISRETLAHVKNPEDALGIQTLNKKLLLDLAEYVDMDSTGVSWLVQLHRSCDAAKGRLVIHSVPPMQLRILKMLNLHTVLHIVDDEQAARNA